MSEISSEKPEKQMPVTADQARLIMRGAINDCAFPISAGEKMKTWLPKVARSVGITANRLYDIYVGETVPRWHEGEAIRLRAQQVRDRWEIMERRQELAQATTDLKRTEDYGAEIKRRRVAREAADSARGEADSQGAFLFWLGREGPGLDRTGNEEMSALAKTVEPATKGQQR